MRSIEVPFSYLLDLYELPEISCYEERLRLIQDFNKLISALLGDRVIVKVLRG